MLKFDHFQRRSRQKKLASGEAKRNLWFPPIIGFSSERARENCCTSSECEFLCSTFPEVTLRFTTGYFLNASPKQKKNIKSTLKLTAHCQKNFFKEDK
jgi:hypothetical protein